MGIEQHPGGGLRDKLSLIKDSEQARAWQAREGWAQKRKQGLQQHFHPEGCCRVTSQLHEAAQRNRDSGEPEQVCRQTPWPAAVPILPRSHAAPGRALCASAPGSTSGWPGGELAPALASEALWWWAVGVLTTLAELSLWRRAGSARRGLEKQGVRASYAPSPAPLVQGFWGCRAWKEDSGVQGVGGAGLFSAQSRW